jgi:hypothetical protein
MVKGPKSQRLHHTALTESQRPCNFPFSLFTMARHFLLFKVLVASLVMPWAAAFVMPQHSKRTPLPTRHSAVPNVESRNASGTVHNPLMEKMGQFVTTAVVALATSPLMAIAEEAADDYEYGAVNAPIGIAWAGGVLAILTALLPVALRGGEEAFEEMKERDAGKFGTGDSSSLDRKRKR